MLKSKTNNWVMESLEKIKERIEVIQGDITRFEGDAVVNAANSSLRGGGGVDGAIHRAAGPLLLEACKKFDGCPTGDAVLTPGYNLKAQWVIHTVGPIWRGGNHDEAYLLASCYLKCLSLSFENKFRQVAFPNISTGIYGFPKKEAAQIAINTVTQFLQSHEFPQEVIFVCYDTENYSIYREMLSSIF